MKHVLFIAAVVLLLGGIYLYLNPEARVRLEHQFRQTTEITQTVTLYKWQNDKGEWQLTDVPPPDQRPYTAVPLDQNANVIPSGKKPAR